MTPFDDDLHHKEQPVNRDHAEQYPTEQESLFDRFESEQTVDAIPLEDLKMERQEEKDKDVTKHTSSSEKKYNGGAS